VRRRDPTGQVIFVTTLAAIIEGPSHGWRSPLIVGLFAVAAVGLALFIGLEGQRGEPLLELRFFRSPPFSGAASMATLAFAVLAGFLFPYTLYLQEVRGDSALMAGVATLPATVAIVVVSPLTGRLVAQRGGRLPMTSAGVFLAGEALVLSHDSVGSSYLYLAGGLCVARAGFRAYQPADHQRRGVRYAQGAGRGGFRCRH
jgi:hypothetical protein